MRNQLVHLWKLPVSVAVGAAVVHAQGRQAIDLRLARQYFDEAKALSDHDGGALWGKPLYGPMMFADHATRMIVADRADAHGKLRAESGVYVGTLPPEHNIANTAFRYAGVKWTMVVWPPPTDRDARGLLLIHELWHRIQEDLGFPSTGPANAHLDSLDGRVWMRLEWAALRQALDSAGDRKTAIRGALVFRAYRRSLFSESESQERGLEMHEGLANYTGAAIAGATPPDRAALAIREIEAGEKKPTYVRSFAYESGPAYGLLLDELAPHWRSGLTAEDDLGELLGKAVGFEPPADLTSEPKRRASAYDGRQIAAEEADRDKERQERLAAARAKFIDGPTLHLPFASMKIQLDPGGLMPLGDFGTVYPTARIVDAWGVLTVTDGALIDKNWSGVTVAAPADPAAKPLVGPGWSLELAEAWQIVRGARPADFRLEKRR